MEDVALTPATVPLSNKIPVDTVLAAVHLVTYPFVPLPVDLRSAKQCRCCCPLVASGRGHKEVPAGSGGVGGVVKYSCGPHVPNHSERVLPGVVVPMPTLPAVVITNLSPGVEPP